MATTITRMNARITRMDARITRMELDNNTQGTGKISIFIFINYYYI